MKKILSTTIIVLIIILIGLLYGRFIGTTGLKTNEIMEKTNILESYDGIKIVHITDIHYKKVITEKRINLLIKEINKINPDILIFTGDLIDKDSTLTNKDINFLTKSLSKINTTYGKYAVMGDNDYKNEETIKSLYIQSNITLLKNEYIIIHNKNNDKIFLGGLDSYSKDKSSIDTMLNDYKEENICYKIIMIHEGDYIPTIISKIPDTNLILAGHSLNGSINIPLIKNILLPKKAKKYYKPYYKINNTKIYISNGVGVNNINFRLFNKPSINLYRIKKSLSTN